MTAKKSLKIYFLLYYIIFLLMSVFIEKSVHSQEKYFFNFILLFLNISLSLFLPVYFISTFKKNIVNIIVGTLIILPISFVFIECAYQSEKFLFLIYLFAHIYSIIMLIIMFIILLKKADFKYR